jgi:hypothetical protein
VEGAAAFPLAAGAHQANAATSDRREWCAEAEFVEEGGW